MFYSEFCATEEGSAEHCDIRDARRSSRPQARYGVYGLGLSRVKGIQGYTGIMENQMEKKKDNAMGTGIIWGFLEVV